MTIVIVYPVVYALMGVLEQGQCIAALVVQKLLKLSLIRYACVDNIVYLYVVGRA